MTIDEAIAREKRIHEENQKVVDTHVLYEEYTLEELYCDDTEVIEEHLNNYRFASEHHKQLAEWLEELKALNQTTQMVDKSNFSQDQYKADTDTAYQCGYNKAIDDFVVKLKEETFNGYETLEDYFEDYIECVSVEDIDSIAEQLKEGSADNE